MRLDSDYNGTFDLALKANLPEMKGIVKGLQELLGEDGHDDYPLVNALLREVANFVHAVETGAATPKEW